MNDEPKKAHYRCVNCKAKATHVSISFVDPGEWDGFAYCDACKPSKGTMTLETGERVDSIVRQALNSRANKGLN